MRKIASIVMFSILAATLAVSASASERTPPGSYLVYRVTTVTELRNEVSRNPLVRSRYSKHFGISSAEFDSFLATEVQLVALKSPLRTRCWYIDKAGAIAVKTKLLPRGAMVFATKDGDPVLSWSCGNPLSSDLPKKKVAKVKTKVMASTETVSQSTKPVETKVLPSLETLSNAVITAAPATAAVSALPVEMAPALATVAAPAVSVAPAISAASGLGFGWLGALGAAGGAAAALSNGGGNKSGPPPEIPEPSSFVVLAGGLFALPSLYRIRFRKR